MIDLIFNSTTMIDSDASCCMTTTTHMLVSYRKVVGRMFLTNLQYQQRHQHFVEEIFFTMQNLSKSKKSIEKVI